MTNKPLIPAILLSLFLLETSLPASAKTVGICYDESDEENVANTTTVLKNAYCDRGKGQFLQIDCNGVGMKNESTTNTITMTIYDSNGVKMASNSTVPGCDLITDHTYWFAPIKLGTRACPVFNTCESWDYDPKTLTRQTAKGMYAVLSTNGNNGFWIDEMYLEVRDGTSAGSGTLAHWGAENGKGFCLSTDPSDADGSWKGKEEGCHKAIKFVVSGCEYPKKEGDTCEDEAFIYSQ